MEFIDELSSVSGRDSIHSRSAGRIGFEGHAVVCRPVKFARRVIERPGDLDVYVDTLVESNWITKHANSTYKAREQRGVGNFIDAAFSYPTAKDS